MFKLILLSSLLALNVKRLCLGKDEPVSTILGPSASRLPTKRVKLVFTQIFARSDQQLKSIGLQVRNPGFWL